MQPKDIKLSPDLSLDELLSIGINENYDSEARIEAFNRLGERNDTLPLQQEVFKSLILSRSPEIRSYCYQVLSLGILNKKEKLISGTNGMGVELAIQILRNESDETIIKDAIRARLGLGDQEAMNELDLRIRESEGIKLKQFMRIKDHFAQ